VFDYGTSAGSTNRQRKSGIPDGRHFPQTLPLESIFRLETFAIRLGDRCLLFPFLLDIMQRMTLLSSYKLL
jgi:hypothetical protein